MLKQLIEGIKRKKSNVGKIVKMVNYQKDWDGRLGKVVGFRGDFDNGDPYVNVFVFSTGSVWPIPGSKLEVVDMTPEEARKVRRV